MSNFTPPAVPEFFVRILNEQDEPEVNKRWLEEKCRDIYLNYGFFPSQGDILQDVDFAYVLTLRHFSFAPNGSAITVDFTAQSA